MEIGHPVSIFCSWSGTGTDAPWRERVLTALRPLAAQGLIALRDDGPLSIEGAVEQEPVRGPSGAALFLALLSPDYLLSSACLAELERGRRRHDAGEVLLIPLVLRACAWQQSAVGDLQPWPSDGLALASRDDPEEGLRQVEQGLQQVLGRLLFEGVRQRDASAAELLCFCACLAPAPIPEALVTQGLARLPHSLAVTAADPSTLTAVQATLEAEALLIRDPKSGGLQVHELLRAALPEQLPAEEQALWKRLALEALATLAIAYPAGEPEHWPLYEGLLPHTLHCAAWIRMEPALQTAPTARLLEQVSLYRRLHGSYQEAASLSEWALAIREQVLGPDHLETAASLHDLAFLYHFLGRSVEALPLLERALAIREQALGPAHSLTVSTLEYLAFLSLSMSRFNEAFPLFERLAPLAEEIFGPHSPKTISALNMLALCYQRQGRVAEACTLFERALLFSEQAPHSVPNLTGAILQNLALLYRSLGRRAEALALLERSLAIGEQTFGPTHRRVAITLYHLALLYRDLGRPQEALPLLERALAICQRAVGPDHPLTRRLRETHRHFQQAHAEQ
ncbi:toll/interleukin-1 receptor domain-containing protein [Thermogemmatispora tikiterensis]|uniref:Uncharacterized protein n=1 Tax=Thermogemmatispora tikiterensis TaxID=1825093 RepID=A0A328VTU2_9CHLR|nr:toll/interleukin-1 receptor domain-containing protein [Thermogemmatispora tikiterensis]RAQ97535.1 hypothetical protein A4R35_18505 [Thermogemmatispora tikiterensis]